MGSGVRHVVEHGRATDKGTRYGTLNQDFSFCEQLPGPSGASEGEDKAGDVFFGAVMDGHGMLGEDSAELVGRSMARFLVRKLRSKSIKDMDTEELEGMMVQGFQRAHAASLELYSNPPPVYDYPKGSPHCSRYRLDRTGTAPYYRGRQGRVPLECGTTCTTCVLHGNMLAIAHVGDSTAVLGYEDANQQDYDAEVVTRDHNCKDAEEANRCRAIPEASVTAENYLRIELGDSECHEIGMSRALGHRLLTDYGLITTPEVSRLELEPRHCCLILASDGVWDHLSPREAVRLVMEEVDGGASAKEAAKELIHQAVAAGVESPQGEADNATAIVYILDF